MAAVLAVTGLAMLAQAIVGLTGNLTRMSEEVAVAPQAELGTEAVGLLQRLIRIDTSNPPGNEGEAQSVLRDLLADAGFECELAARDPARPNLVARLRGGAPGPVLCLLGHVGHGSRRPGRLERRSVVAASFATARCGGAARST